MASQQKECTYDEIRQIAEGLLSKTTCRPQIGIICGSGLGSLADQVTEKTVIPYSDIPAFPVSSVPGHSGQLILGKLSGKSVVVMKGRAHCYEGYSVQKLAIPVRTMKLMGVEVLIVTNAAGGLNEDFRVGDVMILKDHFNMAGFAGVNPLVGANDDRFGPRFPAMSDAYDKKLRDLTKTIGKEMGFESFLREGVYICLVGPNYETVAEARFLKQIGVDACGMSTVPEVLVARHAGMRVLGMSLVTNMVVSDYDQQEVANHQEVLKAGQTRGSDLQALVSALVERMEV
ncbi:purine nucleoside phosphorylase-like [Babylonia areolata]|uniref:purine nucleoside phosphorylase-like n=1 Tax=Babylonia areolata TaxID=304850 RepID=UPI003FD4DFCD